MHGSLEDHFLVIRIPWLNKVITYLLTPSRVALYRDVLRAWESISQHTASTKNEIDNEILWNNHEVTIGGNYVFYKQWYDAGVKTLPAIVDKEGKFMTFTEFKKKYKIKTNFLCYIGLCNGIPKHWRKGFSRDNGNDLIVTEHDRVSSAI